MPRRPRPALLLALTFALAAVTTLGAAGCRSGTRAAAASLAGTVLDAATLAPVGGAAVTLAGHQATSDGDGKFFFGDLAVGRFPLDITAAGYRPYAAVVDVVAGLNTQGPIRLERAGDGGVPDDGGARADGGGPDGGPGPDGPATQCDSPSDCPATGSLCTVPTCDGGLCGTRTLDQGTTCAPSMVCAGTACVCVAGHADCNGALADGCEADLWNDASNCGTCGHGCQGGACAGGCTAVTLAQNASFCPVLALDDGFIYTADNAASTIVRVPKAGGYPTTLALSGGTVRGLGVDYSLVYWANLNQVMQAPKSGGSAFTLASDSEGGQLAVGTSNVYYTKPIAGEVRSVVKSMANSSTVLASGQRTSSGGAMGAYPGPIAVDASHVYWIVDGNASGYPGALRRTDLYGGSYAELMSFGQSRTLAVDNSGAYWTVMDGTPGVYGYLFSSSAAHSLSTNLGSTSYISDALAVDDAYVYWADWYDGCIHRLVKPGASADTVACGLTNPMALAVDAQSLYVIDSAGLRKLAK
ncbi:MAG TPA: carboxypeptidase regulatory-like domain-containing protein [Polyangia bacterium]